MKNIYDLFNHAENQDTCVVKEDRLEMSDMEKRRIYNRILLEDHDAQFKQSSRKDAQQMEAKEQGENVQKERKLPPLKGRKMKKMLTAAACIAVICTIGFTVGAAVKEYLYNNTQYDYREKLDSTESEGITEDAAEGGISGVSIHMSEVRREEENLTFDCTFRFDEDMSEMQTEMEKWAVEEGRNAIGDRLFEKAEVYIDGTNVLDDDFAYVISQTDAYIFGQNVSFEDNEMHMSFLIYPLSMGEDHTIQFCFKDLNMGDHILSGSWEYTYEVSANAYDEELKWQDISIEAEGRVEKMTLNQYAITPNGPKIDATIEKKADTDDINEEDGYSKRETLRIVVWDDLGNYYLMYGQDRDYHADDPTIPYHSRFSIYDEALATQEGLKNREYQVVWDENASRMTFAIEKMTEKWEIQSGKYVGADYEFISEPYVVDLTK